MLIYALLCTVLDRTLVATCKDSIGWMFSKLDTNNDLYLDQAEMAAINLDKYEVCIRPFFNSCDSYRDGKVSTAEWCLCFWRESKLQSYILSVCTRVLPWLISNDRFTKRVELSWADFIRALLCLLSQLLAWTRSISCSEKEKDAFCALLYCFIMRYMHLI